jgi:ATP-dependent Lon protease
MRTLMLIKEQIEVISISSKISSEVEGKLSSRQRDYYLRQQVRGWITGRG